MAKTLKIKQDKPRASCAVTFYCYAHPALFLPWEKMPKEFQKEVDKNGAIPCSGGGRPGEWCLGCRFTGPEDREDD